MPSNAIQDTGKKKDRGKPAPTMPLKDFLPLLEQAIIDGDIIAGEINQLKEEIHG